MGLREDTIDKSSPEQVIIIEPPGGLLRLELGELWHYRELLFFLVWRDIKVRYKQTALGLAWAILQPLLTMIIFSIIFGELAKLPSEGIPYPVFTFTALLPWQLFAFSLNSSSVSLIIEKNLVTRTYFPRVIIPFSAVLGGLFDFVVALVILLGIMAFYGIFPTIRILALPLLILFVIVSALAVGLWLSALNVKYRDVRYVVPFLSQFWMFATPIAYSSSLIPEKWRLLYGLNPMAGVVEGFRWALLGSGDGLGIVMLVSAVMVILLFIGGLAYFKKMEDQFADMI